jgi:hypothetical protein
MGRARVRAGRQTFPKLTVCIFVLDQAGPWASKTTDREDAIPPSPGSGSRRTANQIFLFLTVVTFVTFC